MKTFKSPFLGNLASIPDWEPGAVKALPKRAKASKYDNLKMLLLAQFTEAEVLVAKLERAMHSVDKTTPKKTTVRKQGNPLKSI